MMWFFYNCLFPIAFLLLLPRFLWRMWKRGGYRKGFLGRFGCYDQALLERLRSRPRIWIHAVSVGEIQVALQFMRTVRARPLAPAFVLTTTTSTGHAVAARQIDADDVLLYFPVDLPWIMARVLARLRPSALVLVEGELWPNLLRLARRRKVRVMVLNGRMSERSFRGYRKLRPFVRQALACVDCFCMQGPEDARRLMELGADPARIKIMGSAKYDTASPARLEASPAQALLLKAGCPPASRWLVGGSTWPGEETILLDIYKKLRLHDERVRLALVPRHAERRPAVIAEIRKAGLSVVAWSKLKTAPAPSISADDVLLVDTTGELDLFYELADIIFVGKSLTAHGGQNVIEAAVFAKPIVIGPYTENFAAVIADFRAANALIQVPDADALERAVTELWADRQAAESYGRRAAELVRARSGVIRASAECLMTLLGPQEGPK